MKVRVLLLTTLIVGTACGGTDPADATTPVTVFAAASLTEAFTQIAEDYEGPHDVDVRLSFGPSDGLATQIQEGAPADVFASASPKWMDAVEADPGVTDRADFARNLLVVIVPAGNPAGLGSLDDLGQPGIKLVLAAEGVPVGDYAREMLANAGIADEALANVVSNEDDVKGVVQKVALGEADAGIVYRTDVTATVEADLEVIDVPADVNVEAVYPIAALAGAPDPGTGVRRLRSRARAGDARSGGLPRTVRTRLPAGVVALAALGVTFVLLPVAGLLDRAPWGQVGELLTSEIALEGLRVSLIVSLGAAAFSILIGVPLGLVLGRTSFPGIAVVRALALLPLVLPPVVAGIGLLTAFGRRGLLGGPARAIGLELPFTTAGAALAAAFVSFPFVVLAVEAGLRSLDTRLEDAAASLGGSRWYVLRRVTVPLLAPQIVAGAVLAWARALGEFGATITFAGNFRGETQTMPLAVFEALQSDPGAATILSLVLVVVSLGILIALRGRFIGATA